MKPEWIMRGIPVFGLVLALLATPALGQRKGPRASLLASTQCALDLRDGALLVVTTTLNNKSSGATISEVRAGSMIEGTHKPIGTRGQAFEILGNVLVERVPQDVNPELVLVAEFDLCVGADLNFNGVRDEVDNARELNGLATIFYGISGGAGERRTIMNRCTDDPETPENEGGIRAQDHLAAIEAACAR